MSETILQYTTRGVMDESFIRAANKRIMNPPRNRVIAIVSGSIIALCVVLVLVMGFISGRWDILLDVVRQYAGALLGVAVFMVIMRLVARWSVNQSIKRIAEENTGCRVEYEVGFAEDGVHLHHLTNGGKVVFAYTSLKRLMPVQGDWALLTKTNAFFPVFGSQLFETDRKSVLALLKEKNPKIKIDFKEKK